MMAKTRRAEEGEIDRIVAVDTQAFVNSPYGQATGLDRDMVRQRQRQQSVRAYCCAHPDWVFVAIEAGEIVGFATLEYWPEERAGQIENNAVLPDYRGRGISSALVQRVLEELKTLGSETASVATRYAPDACRVYEKMGFVLERREGALNHYRMDMRSL